VKRAGRVRRALPALAAIAGFMAAGLVAANVGEPPAVAQSGCGGGHALVVVDTGSGVHETQICWSGTISGLDALRLAGANPVTYGTAGLGAAVCQLYGIGNSASSLSSCLEGPNGAYWAYFRAQPGAAGWTYSPAGAGSTTVTSGSMEGWRYGTGAKPPFPCYDGAFGCPPPTTATMAPTSSGPFGGGGPGPTSVVPGPGVAPGSTTTAPADGGGPGTTPTTAVAGTHRGGSGVTAREPAKGTTSGSGSPFGVIVAGGLVVAALGGGALVRRRRRPPPGPPPAG